MKKYTSDEFVATKYGIYKAAQDIITSLPATIIGNGSNVSPWTIKGNMTVSAACGDKTANLLDVNNTLDGYWLSNTTGEVGPQTGYFVSDYIPVIGGNIYNTENAGGTFCWYDDTKTFIRTNSPTTQATAPQSARYLRINAAIFNKSSAFVYSGSSPLPYEPYGYKIPILCGETTNTIYISEPLRKALDGSGLYDTIESSGVLTRRVDSSGDALATPTTEQIAVPTISTTAGAQAFNIDTTLKPSEVDLTYTGWHMYDDKKYSGGWG